MCLTCFHRFGQSGGLVNLQVIKYNYAARLPAWPQYLFRADGVTVFAAPSSSITVSTPCAESVAITVTLNLYNDFKSTLGRQ